MFMLMSLFSGVDAFVVVRAQDSPNSKLRNPRVLTNRFGLADAVD